MRIEQEGHSGARAPLWRSTNTNPGFHPRHGAKGNFDIPQIKIREKGERASKRDMDILETHSLCSSSSIHHQIKMQGFFFFRLEAFSMLQICFSVLKHMPQLSNALIISSLLKNGCVGRRKTKLFCAAGPRDINCELLSYTVVVSVL